MLLRENATPFRFKVMRRKLGRICTKRRRGPQLAQTDRATDAGTIRAPGMTDTEGGETAKSRMDAVVRQSVTPAWTSLGHNLTVSSPVPAALPLP